MSWSLLEVARIFVVQSTAGRWMNCKPHVGGLIHCQVVSEKGQTLTLETQADPGTMRYPGNSSPVQIRVWFNHESQVAKAECV